MNAMQTDVDAAPRRILGWAAADMSSHSPVVKRITRILEGTGATRLATRVKRLLSSVERDLARPYVLVGFGGHFSCGKSTLLNALLRIPFLPVSDYPETGVPCYLQVGTVNSCLAMTARGRVDLDLSREALHEMISVIDQAGVTRPELAGVQRVVLTLADVPIPAGVAWIDMPGINDSDLITQRARAAVAESDVLVWVVNSRQPLSEVEHAVLIDRIVADGPESLMFVVNAFLAEDTLAGWQRFGADLQAYYERRIRTLLPEEDCRPYQILTASARAGLSVPEGFGVGELRQALIGISEIDHPRVVVRRLNVAESRLRTLERELVAAASAADAAWQSDHAYWVRQVALRQTARLEYQREVRAAIYQVVSRVLRELAYCAEMVLGSIDYAPIQYGDGYGRALWWHQSRVLAELADELYQLVVEIARRTAQPPPHPDITTRARALLPTEYHAVEVRYHPAAKQTGWRAAGAVIDRIVDSVTTLGIGTTVGARFGAAVAGSGIDDAAAAAQANDRAAARAGVDAASAAVIAALRAQAEALVELAVSSVPVQQAPEQPSRKVIVALQEAGRLVADPLTAKLREAREKVGGQFASVGGGPEWQAS